jgi:hypothetical protein
MAPTGAIRKCPASLSSSRASTGGLSKWGRHNQSTDPVVVTRAADWQSDNRACSFSGVLLIARST